MTGRHKAPVCGLRPQLDLTKQVRAVAAKRGHTLTQAHNEAWKLYLKYGAADCDVDGGDHPRLAPMAQQPETRHQ